MLFVREGIPCKLLYVENHAMEANRCKIDFHLENLNRSLALYSSHCENFIIIGDFNVEANDSAISVFSDTYDLKSLTKEPTCYKNSNKPSCIDLILTNKPRSFQLSWGLFKKYVRSKRPVFDHLPLPYSFLFVLYVPPTPQGTFALVSYPPLKNRSATLMTLISNQK